MRVVVVGAGPAGLFALRSLQKCFGESGEQNGIEYVCYERRPTVGGEWGTSCRDKETFDKAGHPMMSTVYKELQMNCPTVLWQPHQDHAFPPGTTLYPTLAEMSNYLLTFAEKFHLAKFVKFGKMTADITFDKATRKFSFKVIDMATGQEEMDQCDYMLMAVGQYCVPRIPDHVDFSEFTGEKFHYHTLRDPSRMNGKRILVVGSSWAAMDMIIMLNRPHRAAKMHISWNRHPPLWADSVKKDVSLHPKISKAVGDTVTFEDGSAVQVDVIIFCSGFVQVHPLCEELQLDFNQSIFLFPLYKHTVHPKCPKLFFLGKGNVLGLFMMRPQAEFACQVMKGNVKLPSEQEMLDDIAKFQEYWGGQLSKIAEFNLQEYFPVLELEFLQAKAVIDAAKLEPLPLGDAFMHNAYQCLGSAFKDVMHYKDYVVDYRDDPKTTGQKLAFLVRAN